MGDHDSASEETTITSISSADEIASVTVTKLVSNPNYRSMIKDVFGELMNPFVTAVTELKDEVEKLKGDVLDLQCENKKLLKANRKAEKRFKVLEKCDYERRLISIDLEQRGLRKSIMITGVPEPAAVSGEVEDTDKVVTELIKEKLDINIQETDISSSHRTKQESTDKRRKLGPRPIYVDFTRYSVRKKVIQGRRKLKGTRIGISEVLTEGRKQLLRRVQGLVDHFDQCRACWTWDGVIHMSILEQGETKERRVTIKDHHDINYWGNKFGYPEDKSSSDEEEENQQC